MTEMMETSTDRVLGNKLQLMQPKDGYRAAIDPVLLAAAVPALAGQRVLDLGCGVGTASLCLAARLAQVTIIGIDLQPGLVALARNNAAANALGDRVHFMAGDLLAFTESGFDHVMANPPYLERDKASVSPNPIKAIANVEGAAKLADWVACAARAVRPGGTITFIHRADRAAELLSLLAAPCGEILELPLLPKAGAAPKRVLLQGTRGAGSGAHRLAPWVLHGADGAFTAATEAVLRDAAALPIVKQA